MNKLSKKIVALVTMMLFVVSMMPFAAFAAEEKVSVIGSYFVTSDANTDNDNVEIGEKVDVEFEINNTSDQATTEKLENVVVWAVDAQGRVTDCATFSDAKVGKIANTGLYAAVVDGQKATVSFGREGTYTIYAGVDQTAAKDAATVADLTKLAADADHQVIVVESEDTEVAEMIVDGKTITEKASTTANIALGILSNGVAEKRLEVQVLDNKGNAVKNAEVTISTSSSKLVSNKTTETTDRNGKFAFKLSATKADEYKVYLTCEDFEGVLKVSTLELSAATIKTIATAQTAFDKNVNFNKVDTFEDDIQFEIADSKGSVINGALDEPAAKDAAADRKDYVKIVEQPSTMDLDGEDFKLVPVADEDYYTIQYTGSAKLKEGKYTVQVALKSGASAKASFEVAKFGTATAIQINFDAESVALGDTGVTPKSVKIVDENGVTRNVEGKDGVTFGYTGYAATNFASNDTSFKFNVKDDEKYLGAKITFTAVSEDLGLVGTASVTVQADGQGLEFDSVSGPCDTDNNVKVQVVDGEGNTVAVGENATVTTYVASQSNADAKITVEVSKKTDLAKKGEATLTVSSDKEGTAEIVVVVTSKEGKTYANTLTYTFGKAAVAPGEATDSVVMVIGSTETIVNNEIVSIDAVPFIAQNRTFVPIRALAEDFGATVDWNADAQKVTITLDGKTVEMTIGSKAITVDGAEKTMDVAPMIRGDRTFVPVRFAAEALGFSVTATYNADGTTASVVFAK